ncbi:protein-L-isoaspartate(D-aspartate) O-methyltransferase [Paraburkholderia caffeinilytica]|uniref:protein-L-isoaspartate(D-aspartate) O-methyltransferase n=1 Tax=Paraburkholderia caffeinilytica TaxID=1761016 RepID=UPI0038BCD7C3
MIDFKEARERMVVLQIAGRGVRDSNVLSAMRRVPREEFVPAQLREFAYDDSALPIASRQAISQPAIVAQMLEAAELGPRDRVLDVGTGSGYAAAIAAAIVAHVHSVERDPTLAETARETLARLGIANVTVHLGDGTIGLSAYAPYDAIIAGAGGPRIPQAWRSQLSIGGRIVMPVGRELHHQRLIRLVRRGEQDYHENWLGDVSFVPLIGEDGWGDY